MHRRALFQRLAMLLGVAAVPVEPSIIFDAEPLRLGGSLMTYGVLYTDGTTVWYDAPSATTGTYTATTGPDNIGEPFVVTEIGGDA